MNNPLNVPVLLSEIAGYTHADTIIEGISAHKRATVARHLIGAFAANPQTPFDRGYRLRLDDIVRGTPHA